MDETLLNFIKRERLIAITVVCSIITFQFISSFKVNLIDPLLDFILPDYLFNYLYLTIRDGVEANPKIEQKKLKIDFGQLFREFVKWVFVIALLYILSRNTLLQDLKKGNPGVAIM